MDTKQIYFLLFSIENGINLKYLLNDEVSYSTINSYLLRLETDGLIIFMNDTYNLTSKGKVQLEAWARDLGLRGIYKTIIPKYDVRVKKIGLDVVYLSKNQL